MTIELDDAEKAALVELLRQTIAAEADAPSPRNRQLHRVLEKISDDEAPVVDPRPSRAARAHELAGEWKREVSIEDEVLQQQAEEVQTARRNGMVYGALILAVSAIALCFLLYLRLR